MLRYRLIFGVLMTIVFTALVVLGAWLDGSIGSASILPVKGSVFCLLITLLIIGAVLEMLALVKRTGAEVFSSTVMIASVLLATSWYWRQFYRNALEFHLFYVLFVLAWYFL